MNFHITKIDTYSNIKGYAQDYADKLKEMGNGKGITMPQLEDDVFAVLMEKWDVARLLMHPHCYKLAAIIGIAPDPIDEDRNTITISLLAVNEKGEVLPEHKRVFKEGDKEPPLPGEEVWPKKITIAQMNSFLP